MDELEWLAALTPDEVVREGKCDRCKGTGIDPVRVDHDPDWCWECGGAQLVTVTAEMADAKLRPALMALATATSGLDLYTCDCLGLCECAVGKVRNTLAELRAKIREVRGG